MSKRDMNNIKQTAAKLETYGRNGDTMLAHITPEEAQLLKSVGGSGTINPKTGLPEFFIGQAIGAVTSLAGGLLGGSKAADASRGAAEALRAAGDRAAAMAQFKPMGMTTAFGTSAFTPEGQGSYTLSPELRGLQQNLFGQLNAYNPSQIGQLAQPLIGGSQSLFNLGGRLLPTDTSRMSSQEAQDLANQYRIAQQGLMPASFQSGATPEAMAYANQLNQLAGQVTPTSYDPTAAAQQYFQQQQDLLQPSRAAEEARLATANFGRGTGGLGVQTGTGSAPSNPLAQALFNARAQQDAQIAAQSTDIARQRLRDDIGLGTQLGAAGLTTQQQSEATQRANMLQNLGLSLDFGTQGLRSSEAGTQLARERFAEDLRLGTGLFGTGGDLLGQVPRLTTAGYAPTEAQLGLLRTTETMGQDPFRLSQELAGRYSSAGAQAGQLFMQPQAAAANAYAQYQGYSPMGSALSSIGSTLGSGGFGGGSAQSSVGSWFDNLITRQSNQASPGFVGPSF
jgi:hypothetical protein